MKKTLLLTIYFFLICGLVNAQYGEANQQLISGTFNLSSFSSRTEPNFSSQQRSSSSGLGVGVGYGKFIKKNVLTVFILDYSNNNTKNITNNQVTSNNVSNRFNIGYRQVHFKEIAKKLFLGISFGGDLSYDNSSMKNVPNPVNSNQFRVGVDIKPVLSYQISNRFVINLQPSNSFASLSYSNRVLKDNSGIISKNNGVSFNAGIFTDPFSNMSFGINYLFKNKKK